MSYFLTNQKILPGQVAELSDEEAVHILLSRRIKKGESFNLQGAGEERFVVEILKAERKSLTVKVLKKIQTPPEPEVKITLFQSVVSEKALDFIFQKSTELMAHKIILFNSQNTATKITPEVFKKKYERWNKILWEAAKQSDRVCPPTLEYLKALDDVILSAGNFEQIYLCDIAGGKLNVRGKMPDVAIIIGPEGGFTQKEVNQIQSLPSCKTLSLGPIFLRSETSALASLSIISYLNN